MHLDILRTELEIVQPSRIIALGGTAEKYLRKYFPSLNQGWPVSSIGASALPINFRGFRRSFRRQLLRALTCTQREVVSSRAHPSVKYEVLKSLAGVRCPPQMRVLHGMIANNTSVLNPDLAEPHLMLLVFEAACSGELRTRQHPWRIWQYYRRGLIEEGYISETVDAALT